MMVSNSRISPTLPVVDLERAKKFYHETLGLKINLEDQSGVMFESGDGSLLYIYQRGPTKADHTVASFKVDDIESEVRDLRGRGIKFEEYDIPSMGLKTINGISTWTSEEYEAKSAWFKDTEGNILGLVQMVKVGTRHEPAKVGVHG
jgi:predicted enzyme related to lactoylglutathione lyase